MNCAVDYSVMGPVVDTCGPSMQVIGLVAFAIVWVAVAVLASIPADEKSKQNASRSATPRPAPVKVAPSQAEELPELAPVAASVAPEVEPVTAVPVVEPAPAPVVDPMVGWSRPVIDEAVLDTPAYIRRAGITPYAAYRRLNPLKVPVVLLSARKPELDSEPVFDFGERLPVGFDGAPVH